MTEDLKLAHDGETIMPRLKRTLQMLLMVIIMVGIGVTSHVNANKAPGWMADGVDKIACLVASKPLSNRTRC